MSLNNTINRSLVSLEDYLDKLPAQLRSSLVETVYTQCTTTQMQETLGSLNQMPSAPGTGVSLYNPEILAQYQLLSSVFSNSGQYSYWYFAEGLILGQISIIILVSIFVKFFVFSEGSSKDKSVSVKPSTTASLIPGISSILKRGGKGGPELQAVRAHIVENDEHTNQINMILEKTYYDVSTHKPESLDWFTVLVAQIIQQFREEAWAKDNILNSLNVFIERHSSNLPDFLDSLKITELDIGDDFPIFSNCRINYEKQKLEAKIDIDLIDRLSLGVETKLLVNYPKPGFLALPVNLTVAIVRFQACLTVSLTTDTEFVRTEKRPTNGSKMPSGEATEEYGYYLMFSFSPDYRIEFDTRSLIGSRSKLENIPRVKSLVEYHIRKWFAERCVEPRFQFVKLPSIWPRSKNTREEKQVDGEGKT